VKNKLTFSILLVSTLIILLFLGNSPLHNEGIYPQMELFSKVMAIIQQNYVKEVSVKKLIEGALEGMLSSLDPYSQFMPPEVYQEVKIETEGKFGGVGMVITRKEGIITVISPLEDTPAFRAGIKPGDRIIEIDGESTKGWTTTQAAHKLRGEPGTEVTIKIWREKEEKFLTITLTREIIHIKSVKDPEVLEEGIGYLRISAFREDTDEELRKALEVLKEKRVKALILDLRNNPGGLLQQAVEVSDIFLPPEKLVVYTEGRNRTNRKNYYSRHPALFTSPFPVVIMVNEGSASASEIVAAALKDWKVGILLGEKTFGKGSVQSIIPIDEEYHIRLTTAYYYAPFGECIEGKGLVPDIEVPLTPEEEEKVWEAILEGKREDDIQLKKAIEFLKQEMAKLGSG